MTRERSPRITERPLVSMVMACYNAAPFLGAALRACLNQDYEPLEIMVVDDGSRDGSVAIARSFAPRVQVIDAPHRGQNAARNLGYLLSRGEFIQFCDADDVLARDKISASVAAFEVDPDVDVVFTLTFAPHNHRFDADVVIPALPVPPHVGKLGDPYPHDPRILIPHLNTEQPLFRRRALERYGTWDERLSVYEDLELNFRMFLRGAKYQGLDRIGVVYRNYPSATRVSNREHAAHPSMLPTLEKLVETAIVTGANRGVLRAYLARVLWYAARECASSLRITQARRYLNLAKDLDQHGVRNGGGRRSIGVWARMIVLVLLAVPSFVAKTVRGIRYRMTRDEVFFDSIAWPDARVNRS